MKYLTVKVLLEGKGTVYRDLLLDPTNQLEEVHQAIKDVFGFKSNQLASFINEVGIEFPLENLGDESVALMKDVTVDQLLAEEGDQLMYIFDYVNEWKFHLELIEYVESDEKKECPILLKSYGDSPKENERQLTGEDAEEILMDALLGDELSDDFDDDTDGWMSGDDFESLDNYDEYQ